MRLVVLAARLILLVEGVKGLFLSLISPVRNLGLFAITNNSRSGQRHPAFNMAASSAVWAGDLELKSENACFGGRLLRFVHQSKATKTPMTFTVFLPPQTSSDTPVPVKFHPCCSYMWKFRSSLRQPYNE